MAGGRKTMPGSKGKPPQAFYTDDYFVRPHIFWMLVIPFGIYTLTIATFSPDAALRLVPWPLGNFVDYMGHKHHTICIALCVFTVVMHCVEAAIAGKIAQDKRLTVSATIKWSFMTFLFGFSSLTRLVSYKGKTSGDKQH